jgi:hypothetical protein
VPFASGRVTRLHVELFTCPSCRSVLRRKSDYRPILGSFLGAAVVGALAILPLWMGVPLLVLFMLLGLRWMFELEVNANEAQR